MQTIDDFILPLKQEALKLRYQLDEKAALRQQLEPYLQNSRALSAKALATELLKYLLIQRNLSLNPPDIYYGPARQLFTEIRGILYNQGLDNLVVMPSNSQCLAMEEGGRMPFHEFKRKVLE